jgi:hypothetical protein
MNAAVLSLTLAVLAAGEPPAETKPRRPSPLAPSLPELTKEEEEQLDKIIERFMLADIGVLGGDEAKAAVRDFKKLGSEAIPALVRGVNRAAAIQHSCPVVVIADKLRSLLSSSEDRVLLEFVHDSIGAGVGPTHHWRTLQNLRFEMTLRKNQLARQQSMPPRAVASGPKAPASMSTTELAAAAVKERGSRLQMMLTELERRRGKEVLAGFAAAIANTDSQGAEWARDLLDKHLTRQNDAFLKARLKDEETEVRQAAVRVVAAKRPKLGRDVIDMIADEDRAVRAAARQALVLLSKGQDFGPEPEADKGEQAEAQKKWRTWWDRSGGR